MARLEEWDYTFNIDKYGGDVEAYRRSLGDRSRQSREEPQPRPRTNSQSLYELIDTPKRGTNSLRFPSDLGVEGSDNVIRFNVNVPSGSKYIGGEAGNKVYDSEGEQVTSERRTREGGGSIASRFSENVVRTDTVIDLFLPPSIQTSYSSNWANTALGNTGAAIDAAYGLGNISEGGQLQNAINTTMNTLTTAIPGIASRLVDTIARTNTEAARQAITSTATNPYMEVLFEGINPRTFSFTFKMIPRNQSEQQTISNIVKQFKFHQAPENKFDGQSNFWIFPSEFDISFLYKGQENHWIHKISTCACTNVQVEYTSEGQYSSLRDGSPFSTTLTLEFTEMELLTKSRILEGY